jgi:hypothetical protein
MAARLRKTHQDEVRTKIQTSQLINRLTNHALGKIELTSTQIKSIEILLKKSMPDLSQVQGAGEEGEHKHVFTWQS